MMHCNMDDRVQQAVDDSNRWFPLVTHTSKDIAFWALNICGEAGELANKVKKVVRGSVPYEAQRAAIADELVDTLVYCFNMAAALEIELEEEYDRKRRFNEHRFTRPDRAEGVEAGSS